VRPIRIRDFFSATDLAHQVCINIYNTYPCCPVHLCIPMRASSTFPVNHNSYPVTGFRTCIPLSEPILISNSFQVILPINTSVIWQGGLSQRQKYCNQDHAQTSLLVLEQHTGSRRKNTHFHMLTRPTICAWSASTVALRTRIVVVGSRFCRHIVNSR
jgi:hypothetical protein